MDWAVMMPTPIIRQLYFELQADLDRILSHFKPGCKVTVVVRVPDASDADVVIGNDDLDLVMGTIAKMKDRQATMAPPPQ